MDCATHTPVAVVVSLLEMHYKMCLDHGLPKQPPPSFNLHHTHLLKKTKTHSKKIVDEWPLSLFDEKYEGTGPPRPVLIFFSSIIIALVQGQFCVGVGDLEEC